MGMRRLVAKVGFYAVIFMAAVASATYEQYGTIAAIFWTVLCFVFIGLIIILHSAQKEEDMVMHGAPPRRPMIPLKQPEMKVKPVISNPHIAEVSLAEKAQKKSQQQGYQR